MQQAGFDDALGASYRLEDRLGQGATGEVWRAVDRRTDEVVAAKLLRQEHVADHDLVTRFLRERSILTGLRHPNVVAVRDLVVEGDRLAIVMDHVDGGSLRDVLTQEGPLPPATAVDLAAAVLDGLAAAHDSGVLHRDVKPDNVLLTSDWRELSPGAVRITDFGIARIVAEGGRRSTGLLGTPEYMCPELIVTGSCDLPADVYGAGVLLYELLAGRTPFAGPGTDYTVAHRHVTSAPPRLPVPEPLWTALESLLDKNPAARPTAADAAALLRRLRPEVADLPALTPQPAPDDFGVARGPATVVRGITPDAEPAPTEDTGDSGHDGTTPDGPDLGTPSGATVVRPMQRPARDRPRPTVPTEQREARPARPVWRDPRVAGTVLVALLLLGGAVAFATGGDDEPTGPSEPGGEVTASQQGTPAPTGLTVSRAATYDAESGTAEVTITYAAQNAPLAGPFLEVLPGTGSTCPAVQWPEGDQDVNVPSTTDVTADCAWSIDPLQVPAQGTATVTAVVQLDLAGEDPTAALQEWLDGAAAATTAAVEDAGVRGTAYPAQRMRGVEIVAPPRTVSGRTLTLRVLPVWPNGVDRLNPVYQSPSVGEPASMLTAIAGGEKGVRFSDGCSGALAVQNAGLVVTALSPAPECTVVASVGNFVNVPSAPFAIVTRGG